MMKNGKRRKLLIIERMLEFLKPKLQVGSGDDLWG